MKFILFDIDGTIMDSGGAGTRAMNSAFMELFSVTDAFRKISMAGKTDFQILKEGCALHNIDCSNGAVPEFYRVYVRHLQENMRSPSGHLKPGINRALQKLHNHEDFILGLLTGNIEEGAMIKLGAFGLDTYFDVGAFGSDDEDRDRLLPIALDKLSRRQSLQLSYEDCIVIGDTPRDVTCSKPYGAFSIAVATGPYSAASLSAAGADIVLDDLSDTNTFMSILNAV